MILKARAARLRDYVNAIVGFDALGAQMQKRPKSPMRMLSEDGNPRADNLFALASRLKAHEGVSLECARLRRIAVGSDPRPVDHIGARSCPH